MSFTIAPGADSNSEIFARKIQRVELNLEERPSDLPDYNVIVKLINNDFVLFDFNPDTGLGAVLRDRNGNGRYDGATLFLKDNALGDVDPTVGVIRDPAGAAVMAVNQNNPRTVTITDGEGDRLTAIYGTTFNFSVQGSRSASQILEAVFADGTTQTILTTLGNASGIPVNVDSLLANLQSPLGTKNSDGRKVSFQLREVGSNAITELTINNVTPTRFNLSGNNFNISAEIVSGVGVELHTQKIQINGEGLEAISLRDLTPTSSANTMTIAVEAQLYREASFNNMVGFYLAERTTGAVVDPLTGITVAGFGNSREYLSAVRNHSVLTGSVDNNQTGGFANEGKLEMLASIDLSAHVLLPFLVVNGNMNSVSSDFSNLYVAGMSSNSDRSKHIQFLGNNIFGFEDKRGGGDQDFDDIIVEVTKLTLL